MASGRNRHGVMTLYSGNEPGRDRQATVNLRPVWRLITIALAIVFAESAAPRAVTLAQPWHSHPGAPHTLYLDFDGYKNKAVTWVCGPHHQISLPDFEVRATIAQSYLIYEVWQRVAEHFAPFNIDVTTEAPAILNPNDPRVNLTSGNAVRIAIGKEPINLQSEALGWAPATCDVGAAYAHPDTPNLGVAYTEGRTMKELAHTVSHEAGHVFGLDHYLGPVAEWRVGFFAPIMSHSTAYRDIWYSGENQHGNQQDDVAQLSALLGRRRPDHANNVSLGVLNPLIQLEGLYPYRPAGSTSGDIFANRLYGRGIIESLNDADYFVFRVIGEGTVQVRVYLGVGVDVELDDPIDGPGPNLRAAWDLWTPDGMLLAERQNLLPLELSAVLPYATPPPSGNGTTPSPVLYVGEQYLVAVRSQGQYGDLGNYTIVVNGPVADLSGPQVVNLEVPCTDVNPRGKSPQWRRLSADRLWVTFNQPIDPLSVFHNNLWPAGSCECSTLDPPTAPATCKTPPLRWHAWLSGPYGMIPFSDPNGMIPITDIIPTTDRTPTRFLIRFPQQTQKGSYTITIGSDIAAFGRPVSSFMMDCGYPLNQDGDFLNGEPWQDRYTQKFRIDPEEPAMWCTDTLVEWELEPDLSHLQIQNSWDFGR